MDKEVYLKSEAYYREAATPIVKGFSEENKLKALSMAKDFELYLENLSGYIEFLRRNKNIARTDSILKGRDADNVMINVDLGGETPIQSSDTWMKFIESATGLGTFDYIVDSLDVMHKFITEHRDHHVSSLVYHSDELPESLSGMMILIDDHCERDGISTESITLEEAFLKWNLNYV